MNTPFLTNCRACASPRLITVDSYKRVWSLCTDCGAGNPTQKKYYPLQFLPIADFQKTNTDEAGMYDYFTAPVHIQYSIDTAVEFTKDYIVPWNIEVHGKKILDVSGGNGHFINEFKKMGAEVTLSEINIPSIEYAKNAHGINVFEFNFNEHRIHEKTDGLYDIVMLRAAVMFCKDLKQHAQDLASVVKQGGIIIVNHSVIPTLGVILRVQIDEFSYMILRQPEQVIADFKAAGFSLAQRKDETDPSLYVYDHDLKKSWMFLHWFYEIKAVRALFKNRIFSFPARDRRRSTLMFVKN